MATPPDSLDIRLFYIRLSSSSYSSAVSAPSHLTLDLAGRKTLPLRRDRFDRTAGEATYVSTDSFRLATSKAEFEVSDERGSLLLCGTIGREGEAPWTMSCYSCAISSFMGKIGAEIYMAGSFAGTPLILTQTVHLSPRKTLPKPGPLDSIPETHHGPGPPVHRGPEEDTEYKLEYCYSETDGEMSWFNAGVRVGVGLGLGMCVGIGIGVGILMRSYQVTTRSFKRRFW
ncbi:hypothetical protein LUZ60_007269 [Juncus effusus]|nr:hypothetical protein LUZ60_007269 [Juncus effusus]